MGHKIKGPAYRGVIEGFYGPLWTHADRLRLLERMPAWNMNLYIYAPKTDPYHRFRWETPYPREELRKFAELARRAEQSGVMLAIAISPGNTFNHSRPAHRARLMRKLRQFCDVGCEFFPILYDDLHVRIDFNGPSGAAHAEQQAAMMNYYVERLAARVPRARFLFCPTEYGTAETSAYLTCLHALLDRRVETICTGVDGPGYQVVPKTFSNQGAAAYFRNFGRKPFLWDNFNVSDWTLNVLNWSPYSGRGDRLDELCSGIVLNPQNICLMNWPVFGTMGEYFTHPRRYNPQTAMGRQLTCCLGRAGAAIGRTLARWYTTEGAGYRSSELNLPDIETGLCGTPDRCRRFLRTVQRIVAPTRAFDHAFDHARLPPEWAGHLGAYANMLKWWSYETNALCEAALKALPITSVQAQSTRKALAELRGYSYRLPASLLDYLERLATRLAQ